MGTFKSVVGIAIATLLLNTGLQAQVTRVVRPAVVKPAEFNGTHEQASIIDIKKGGGSTTLNTFCVDANGNVLAACGGDRITYAIVDGKRVTKKIAVSKEIRVFAPNGDHLKTWKVDITPQAICSADDGTIYVAGDGKILQLNAAGKVLKSVDSPHVGDMQKFAEAVRLEAIEQQKRLKTNYERIVKQYEDQIALIEAKPAAEQTAAEKNRLTIYKRNLPTYKRILENPAAARGNTDMLVARKLKMSSVCVTSDQVFVATPATKGYGFEVWSTDLNFKNAKQLITGLRGCCGQMDIKVKGNEIFVAENSRHRVCRYDLNGKLLGTFGKKDRSGEAGFSSCCNPMNLCFGPQGELITGESSLGLIKRFDSTGKLLGVIGTAKVATGCKNVAVHMSSDGKLAYMLDLTAQRIIVLAQKPDKKVSKVD
jgi:sugar lactone lactonase YvrE